jgi:CheY-like chemotaxis protein
MAFCPAYDGSICSLCCTLDARCHDVCKSPAVSAAARPLKTAVRAFLDARLSARLGARVLRFAGTFSGAAGVVALIFWAICGTAGLESASSAVVAVFVKLYAAVVVLIGIGAWWLVLSRESRELVEEELDRQNEELSQEVAEHKKTEDALSCEKHRALEVNRQLSIAMAQSEALARAAEGASQAARKGAAPDVVIVDSMMPAMGGFTRIEMYSAAP